MNYHRLVDEGHLSLCLILFSLLNKKYRCCPYLSKPSALIYFPLVVKHSFLFPRKHTDVALSIFDKTCPLKKTYPLKGADSCITGTMMLLFAKDERCLSQLKIMKFIN